MGLMKEILTAVIGRRHKAEGQVLQVITAVRISFTNPTKNEWHIAFIQQFHHRLLLCEIPYSGLSKQIQSTRRDLKKILLIYSDKASLSDSMHPDSFCTDRNIHQIFHC